MHRHILHVLFLALLSVVLAACGTKPRPTIDTRMFDIRGVGVTANGSVPAGVIVGIRRQMEMALEATSHAVPKVRAVMNIHVATVSRERNGPGRAELSVTISDVESGQPVFVRGYLVLASSESGRVSDAAIADAVASRLRYEYALSMPQLRKVLRHDPELSTRLGTEARRRKSVEPVVIPLKTAPVLGADQDPVLNSKTRVDPVVEPARVEPAVKARKTEVDPVETTVESGAKAKVVIKPRATDDSADDEPCVETLDRKC